MNIRYAIKSALTGLSSHKSRSALTILGIVIGITAIIVIMSIGQGAQELILNQIRGMGSAIINIDPGREPQGLSDFTEIFTDSLKEKDIQAMRNPANVQGVKDISPLVSITTNVSFGAEAKRTMVLGGSELLISIFDIKVEQGQFFNQDHIRQRSAVAVLGSEIKQDLFGSSDAVGEKIKIQNKTFRVVGILKPKGTAAMLDVDSMVAIPYSTAQNYLLGINYYHSIIVQAESEEIVPRVARDIELTLREQHGITDPDKDDFHVTTQADAVETVGLIMDILTLFLSAVAAISLIVGGIGIMNIMLVSVTERTHEIGLRKAIGATENNILVQFLLEAIILTSIGGLIGIALGSSFSFLASLILSRMVSMGWVFTISLTSIILGISVAGSVGIIFGLYPAFKASRKNPVDALRYE